MPHGKAYRLRTGEGGSTSSQEVGDLLAKLARQFLLGLDAGQLWD